MDRAYMLGQIQKKMVLYIIQTGKEYVEHMAKEGENNSERKRKTYKCIGR